MRKISENNKDKTNEPVSFNQLQTESVQHIMEQQNIINSIAKPATEVLNQTRRIYANNNIENLNRLSNVMSSLVSQNKDLFKTNSLAISNEVLSAMQSYYKLQPLASAMASIVKQYSVYLGENVLKLIKSVDFAPLKSVIETLVEQGFNIQYYRYSKIFCYVMYNAEWLPYLDYITEYELFTSLNEIIAASQYGSQRQIKKIDKTIIDYYNQAKLNQIKKSWDKIIVEKHYMKMLSQSIDAYWRKKYILTICTLATLWETFLFKFQEKERHTGKIVKSKFKELSNENGDKNITDFLFAFFEKHIMGQCDSIEDVRNDLPNRHGVAHGWWKEYPSKKSALNAILLTDLILKL